MEGIISPKNKLTSEYNKQEAADIDHHTKEDIFSYLYEWANTYIHPQRLGHSHFEADIVLHESLVSFYKLYTKGDFELKYKKIASSQEAEIEKERVLTPSGFLIEKEQLAMLASWLLTNIKYKFLDLHRRNRRLTHIELPLNFVPEEENPDIEQTIKQIDIDDLSSEVSKAILELSDRPRDVLMLFYYSGMSTAEIAEHLNLKQGTVRQIKVRALNQLRLLFKDRLDFL